MTLFSLVAFDLVACIAMGAFVGYVIPLTDREISTPDRRRS